MPTSFFSCKFGKKYLHLQQVSVHSRHIAKVDFFFAVIVHVGQS